MNTRRIALIAVIAFVAALLGAYVGRTILPHQSDTGAELHSVLHNELNLDPAQERQLMALERAFVGRRRALEATLRADNNRLADAIAAEHVYGPRVSVAVDATHHSMGALQKATLEHVFAMRNILRPDQHARFDAAVDEALTVEAR